MSSDSGSVERGARERLVRRAEAARLAASHTRARSRELRAARRGEFTLAAGLSKKELEVLSLLAAGLTTKAIAHQLAKSANTVNYHLANIYRKLRVHSRVDASSGYLRIVREQSPIGLTPSSPQ